MDVLFFLDIVTDLFSIVAIGYGVIWLSIKIALKKKK
jgi:hypothetical protein